MLNDAQRAYLATAIRTMQIIVIAMLMGTGMFFAIVLVIVSQGPGEPLLTYAALGFSLLMLIAWALVPGIVASRGLRRVALGNVRPRNPWAAPPPEEVGEVAPLAGVFQTRLITALGILENAIFFNLVAYMISTQIVSLVAAGVLTLLLASHFPTRTRLEDWLAMAERTVEEIRELPR